MEQYFWDGPEDSDEEIPSIIPFKKDYEIQNNIKFSKKALK